MGSEPDSCEESPQFGTKAWVRVHWDPEQENAPKEVVFIKLLHEWHIFVPGLFAGLLVGYVFWSLDAPRLDVVTSSLTAFGSTYYLFFDAWWCSTVTRQSL